MAVAGDIHYIPKSLSFHDDPKDRLHTLLNECTDARHGAAVYGSRSKVPAKRGTVARLVQPTTGPSGNGLRDPTYFYPVILRPSKAADLDPRKGALTPAELRDLKALVPSALGFGSGNCYDTRAASRSKRGVILKLIPAKAGVAGTPYGVVLTSHSYSARDTGFLAVVPLMLDADPEPGRDVLIEHVMRFEEIAPDAESALMLATGIYSIQRERHVAHYYSSLVVPNAQLEEAEGILTEWLDL